MENKYILLALLVCFSLFPCLNASFSQYVYVFNGIVRKPYYVFQILLTRVYKQSRNNNLVDLKPAAPLGFQLAVYNDA